MRGSIIFLLVTLASGCSTLESYFPDKEKDYQYTSEVPMLNWPAEIRRNKPVNGDAQIAPEDNSITESAPPSESTTTKAAESPATESAPAAATENASPEVSPTEVVNSESDDRTVINSVEIVKYDDGESRLRLGTGFAKAWRAVSKALSHNAIEVTERNHDKGLITLQYDPNEKKAKDDSFWDELNFFFHGINTNEEEYRLKLEEHNEKTDVLVLSQEHLPMLNNDSAVHLLKVIAGTIKADIAEQDKSADKAESQQPAGQSQQ